MRAMTPRSAAALALCAALLATPALAQPAPAVGAEVKDPKGLPVGKVEMADALFYTSRRLARLPTERERRFGSQSSYTGTETFVSRALCQ